MLKIIPSSPHSRSRREWIYEKKIQNRDFGGKIEKIYRGQGNFNTFFYCLEWPN